jgi:hypothetical protein
MGLEIGLHVMCDATTCQGLVLRSQLELPRRANELGSGERTKPVTLEKTCRCMSRLQGALFSGIGPSIRLELTRTVWTSHRSIITGPLRESCSRFSSTRITIDSNRGASNMLCTIIHITSCLFAAVAFMSLLIHQPNDLPVKLTQWLVMLGSAPDRVASSRFLQLCQRSPKALQLLHLLVPVRGTLLLFRRQRSLPIIQSLPVCSKIIFFLSESSSALLEDLLASGAVFLLLL